MSKPRAAALLGGLAMVGVLVLSSLVGAQQSYFQQLKGALGRACLQYTTENVPDDDREVFRAACSFASVVLQEPREQFPLEEDQETPLLNAAALAAFKAEAPGLGTVPSSPTVDTCDDCIVAIQTFESFLATNGTAAGLEDAVQSACRKKFTETAQVNQCLETVAGAPVPELIDFILANFPPATACQALQFCPPVGVSASK